MATPVKSSSKRFWELDALRGAAVAAMIVYHFIFDLVKIHKVPWNFPTTYWIVGPSLIAGTFLTAAGFSAWLRFEKTGDVWRSSKRHFLKIGLVALALTLGTLMFSSDTIIVFGILHCIALSVLLGTFFLKASDAVLVGVMSFCLGYGFYVEVTHLYDRWFNALGRVLGRTMLDFYPMVPWFGFYLLGMWAGRRKGKNWVGSPHLGWAKPLEWMGRHALGIYLIHQPILLGVLALIF